MAGKKRRKAHRVPQGMASPGQCQRCEAWFDRKEGAEDQGQSWFLLCATCRKRSAIARKRRDDLLPPGVLLEEIRYEMGRGGPPVKVQNTFPFQIEQELAHMRRRKHVRPVDGRAVAQPQLHVNLPD